jgi:Flp pilus assembly pilin Flp
MMRDEAGQALVEYLLITALVVLGSYGLMWVLSDMLVKYYNEIAAYVCLPVP